MNYTLNDAYGRVEHECTLAQAQKYMTKLKAHQGPSVTTDCYGRKVKAVITPSVATIKITNNIQLYDINNLTAGAQIEIDRVRDERDEKRAISYDIIAIKDVVHRTNAKHGVDKLLSLRDFLNAELADLKPMLKTLQSAHPIDNLKVIKESYDNSDEKMQVQISTAGVDVAVYDKATVEKTIEETNKKINEIENERDKLNTTVKVILYLSKYSVKALGI
jgi:hypothetical protein